MLAGMWRNLRRAGPTGLDRSSSWLLFAFAAAGCTSAAARGPAGPDYTADPACSGINNSFRCARSIEERELAAAGGRVLRSGDTLTVLLDSNGATKLIDGASSIFPEDVSYSFFGTISRASLLLFHAQFGEGSAFAVVNSRTGRLTGLEGWPLAAPDGRALLIAEDGYFNRIGVFLYELEGDSLRCVLALDELDWVPGWAAWSSPTSAWVERRHEDIVHPDSTRIVGRLHVAKSSGRWAATVH